MTALESQGALQHELDAEGHDAGVELEQLVLEDEEIKEPFDPRLIDVTTEVRSLDVLVKRIRAHQIDLDPDFQRSRGIWTTQKKSLLIESLLLRIPLPTFYVAEIGTGEELGESAWAVVDGIQRLSTIVEFVEPSVFGMPALRLRGLQYLKAEEGRTFHELSQSLQLRILESQFTIQVIRRSTPEAVKLNIFARINTGGVPLSAQELRHALTPGPARKILRTMALSPEFQDAVASSVSPTRMADREMALRFIAFRLSNPESHKEPDFDRFLRDAMRGMNDWDLLETERHLADFKRAMVASRKIFATDAFRKRYAETDPRRPVSKALFEAVSVATARVYDQYGNEGLDQLVQKSSAIRAKFVSLMNDREFDRSISQGTGDPVRVRLRFRKLRELMESVVKGDS
jgi:Protein of unknown function DUF262